MKRLPFICTQLFLSGGQRCVFVRLCVCVLPWIFTTVCVCIQNTETWHIHTRIHACARKKHFDLIYCKSYCMCRRIRVRMMCVYVCLRICGLPWICTTACVCLQLLCKYDTRFTGWLWICIDVCGMCGWLWICIYVCLCVLMTVNMYLCVSVCVDDCEYVSTCVCMCWWLWTCIDVCWYVLMTVNMGWLQLVRSIKL